MTELSKIADSGDELETLRGLRQKIAATIDASKSGRDIAALSKQLREIITRISDLEAREDETDEISQIVRGKAAVRDRGGRARGMDSVQG